MCFSAEADLVAGVVVGVLGVDAVRHVRCRAEWPIAALPLVFAGHQLVESFVWLGLRGDVPRWIERSSLWIYLVVAFGVIPILVPVAVTLLEPVPRRGRLWWFTTVGAFAACVLTYPVIRGPVVARIGRHHIEYQVDLWHGGTMVGLYVVATCTPLFLSSHRHIRWFGALNLVAIAVLILTTRAGFVSLWCSWAAITSFAITLHLRSPRTFTGPPATTAAATIVHT